MSGSIALRGIAVMASFVCSVLCVFKLFDCVIGFLFYKWTLSFVDVHWGSYSGFRQWKLLPCSVCEMAEQPHLYRGALWRGRPSWCGAFPGLRVGHARRGCLDLSDGFLHSPELVLCSSGAAAEISILCEQGHGWWLCSSSRDLCRNFILM